MKELLTALVEAFVTNNHSTESTENLRTLLANLDDTGDKSDVVIESADDERDALNFGGKV